VYRHGRKSITCHIIFAALVLDTTGTSQVVSTGAARHAWQHASEAGRAAQWVAYHTQQARWQPHRSEFAALAWQWKAYETQQKQWASYYQQMGHQTEAMTTMSKAAVARLPPITMRGGCAYGLRTLPSAVHRVIDAANVLQTKPYLLGGGHQSIEDVGYDCSSATSYVLIKAGLLNEVLNSSRFGDYGEAGPGRYVTIWVKPGHHVFVTICGLRLDTSGGRVGEGPRWRTTARSLSGFTPRHPPGL